MKRYFIFAIIFVFLGLFFSYARAAGWGQVCIPNGSPYAGFLPDLVPLGAFPGNAYTGEDRGGVEGCSWQILPIGENVYMSPFVSFSSSDEILYEFWLNSPVDQEITVGLLAVGDDGLPHNVFFSYLVPSGGWIKHSFNWDGGGSRLVQAGLSFSVLDSSIAFLVDDINMTPLVIPTPTSTLVVETSTSTPTPTTGPTPTPAAPTCYSRDWASSNYGCTPAGGAVSYVPGRGFVSGAVGQASYYCENSDWFYPDADYYYYVIDAPVSALMYMAGEQTGYLYANNMSSPGSVTTHVLDISSFNWDVADSDVYVALNGLPSDTAMSETGWCFNSDSPTPTPTVLSTSTPSPTSSPTSTDFPYPTSTASPVIPTVSIPGTLTSTPLPVSTVIGPGPGGTGDVDGVCIPQVMSSVSQSCAPSSSVFCQLSTWVKPLAWGYDMYRASTLAGGYGACRFTEAGGEITRITDDMRSLTTVYGDFWDDAQNVTYTNIYGCTDLPFSAISGETNLACTSGTIHCAIKKFILGSTYFSILWHTLVAFISIRLLIISFKMLFSRQFISPITSLRGPIEGYMEGRSKQDSISKLGGGGP